MIQADNDNEGTRNVILNERSAGKRGHGKDEKHHWVVVFSKKAFMIEPKTLENKIKKEEVERTGRERDMESLQS